MVDEQLKQEIRIRNILEDSEDTLMKIYGNDKTNKQIDCEIAHTSSENSTIGHSSSMPTLYKRKTATIAPKSHSHGNLPPADVIYINHNPSLDGEAFIYEDRIRKDITYYKIWFIIAIAMILAGTLTIQEHFQLNDTTGLLSHIFAPLFFLEIIELFNGCPLCDNRSDHISPILFLLVPRNDFFERVVKGLQIIVQFSQDVMIYFFVFSISYRSFSYTLHQF